MKNNVRSQLFEFKFIEPLPLLLPPWNVFVRCKTNNIGRPSFKQRWPQTLKYGIDSVKAIKHTMTVASCMPPIARPPISCNLGWRHRIAITTTAGIRRCGFQLVIQNVESKYFVCHRERGN